MKIPGQFSVKINSGDGNDDINSGVSDYSYLYGEDGNDIIDGSQSTVRTQAYGGNGDDVMTGGAGNDHLQGDNGNDLINAGAGNDNIYGQNNDDTLNAGDGNDYIDSGNGSDLVDAGAGNDTIYLDHDSNSNDTVDAGDGNDTLHRIGYYSADIVDAGAGDDILNVRTQGNEMSIITLGAGADSIVLDQYAYGSNAGGGITITDFDTSEDVIDMDTFVNNGITNWDGQTNPFGGGHMRLIQDGANVIMQVDRDGGGNAYLDLINFQNTDIADFNDQNFLIDVATSQGYSPTGGGVNGTALGGTIAGETLTGTFGDDAISGIDGNDSLIGGNGSDILDGGDGDDQITGGFGNDDMTGGAGADEFIFNIGEGQDVIQDFTVGVDTLVMTGGQSIASLSEIDTDGVGGVDSMLVTLADDSTITLDSLLGITDPQDLL